jgi:peptidoglycan/xylan/chitin deacetylase (PgdA/CDA1 family)
MKISKFTLKVLAIFIYVYIFIILFSQSQIVLAAPVAPIEDKNIEKVIYLTFDDGPSILTDRVLDILKENEVKATFFIIGNQIKGFENTIKRIHEEGHSLGLHSYTHKFKLIYSSSDIFINEMLETQSEIHSLTGIHPTIIRFPGGSRKRLTKPFLVQLHSLKLKVYDWNAYMSDGINWHASPDKLYTEATKSTVSEYPIILLMHCDYMHKNTCKALPKVIKYYKDLGFEFKIISEDTPEYYVPLR